MRAKIKSEVERRRRRRKASVTKRLRHSDRTLLTVYRSARHIYAQLVDPVSGRTLLAVSSRSREVVGDAATGNAAAAARVGAAVARLARERNIERVVFNRNGFLYHGRVKALAEAARAEGLQF